MRRRGDAGCYRLPVPSPRSMSMALVIVTDAFGMSKLGEIKLNEGLAMTLQRPVESSADFCRAFREVAGV